MWPRFWNKPLRQLPWIAASGMLAVVLLLAGASGQAQEKKNPPARWTVVKVEFKGPGTIADPINKGQAKPKRQFEFGKDGGKVVEPGKEKETPYITISHAADLKPKADEFKIMDGLGQSLAGPSTYAVGRNNMDVLVFKRDSWKEYGELYLAGPGDQKIALSKFLPVEDQASWKLTTAKLLADSQADKAKDLCQQILKQYPRSKAAKEARQLLNSLNK